MGKSQTEISRLETGPAIKNLDKLVLWARTLAIPPRLLWFKLPEADDPTGPAGVGDPPNERPWSELTELARSFPVLDLDELAHLSLGLERAGYFDDASAAFLDRQLQSCAAHDGMGGPREALPTVLALLATITRSSRDVRPGVRREFLKLGTRAAELAGWLYRDLGSSTGAEYWRDRAFEWAAEVDDLPMCGYVLLRKSQSAWDERDASRMLALADAARSPTWRLPTRVQAEVAQQQARGHAMLGSSPDVVERKLDEAWDLLGHPPDPSTDLGAAYNTTLLTMQTAICRCEAGDAARAVEEYRTLVSTPDFSHRDRGYLLALFALACQGANEPDEAARNATEALSIATPTASRRTVVELERLSQRLSLWASRPLVREFREALRLAS